MLTPDDGDAIRWRVIFDDDEDSDPPMAVECKTFEEAWDTAIPANPVGWSISYKDRATSWFSIKFTRYQPFVVATRGSASTKIQLLY
jgi:hypothetical protein